MRRVVDCYCCNLILLSLTCIQDRGPATLDHHHCNCWLSVAISCCKRPIYSTLLYTAQGSTSKHRSNQKAAGRLKHTPTGFQQLSSRVAHARPFWVQIQVITIVINIGAAAVQTRAVPCSQRRAVSRTPLSEKWSVRCHSAISITAPTPNTTTINTSELRCTRPSLSTRDPAPTLCHLESAPAVPPTLSPAMHRAAPP